MAVKDTSENATLFDFTDTDTDTSGDSDREPESDTDTTAADRDRPTSSEVLAEPVDLTIKDDAREPEPETGAEDEPVDVGEDGDEDETDLSDVPFGEIDVSFNIEPEEGETESESEVEGEYEDEDESEGVGDVKEGGDGDDEQLVDISELPKWLDSDDIPRPPGPDDPGWSWDLTRPECCEYCGIRGPWDEPLERGEYDPDWEPCPPSHAGATSRHRKPCTCCACPSCGNTSFYFRKTKDPRFKCHNRNCGEVFDDPVPVPPDFDEWPRSRLLWSCRQCGNPTLCVTEGLGDVYLPDYYK